MTTVAKTLSPQQTAVVGFIQDGEGSGFVEAVAGSGKTTTLIEGIAVTTGSVAFCGYNRAIIKEVKAKVADRADPESKNYDPRFAGLGNRLRIGTFHSFGLNAWRQVHPKVQVDERKKRDMTIAQFQANRIPEGLHDFILELVSLAKQRALGLFGDIEDRSKWFEIVDHFDLSHKIEDASDESINQGVDFAIRTLKYHRALAPKIIDYDDMIYMPVVTGVRVWENDFVFVDEAQDTNPARRALARKMLKKTGRAIFVGDRYQAIYGFTGADNDAVDQIVCDFNCKQFPLTVTYRCPKSVVAVAQEIVPHIQAHESAPEGSVSNVNYVEFIKTATADNLKASDAILCRKTAPLVDLAFTLLRRQIPCHVEGRDIGAGLIKLVDRFSKAKDMHAMRDMLAAYAEREVAKLVAKGKETQAEALQDRVDTLIVLMDAQPPATSVAQLRERIKSMFVDGDDERKPTLTLATAHRSKGREWQRVFALGYYEFMPSPWARKAWQLDQESNLKYVLVTRSQGELVFINGVVS